MMTAKIVIHAPGVAFQQRPVFRAGVDLVNLGVTVTDRKGKRISDLTADDFVIAEDGKPQRLQFFASALGPVPEMHLGLLLDVSASMESDIGFMRTASIKFLNSLTEAADVTVVDFDTEVRAARYGQSEFPRLIERIRLQKTGGETALFDAIGVYLDGAASQEGRKVMVLYTDGGDTRSAMRLHELLDLVRASDVTIYAVGVLDRQSMTARTQQQMVLREITEITGGQVFFPPSVKELEKVYEQVVAEIRAQYTIGYISTNGTADGTWRKVEIKLNRRDSKDLRIRSRKGYFAPYRP